MALSPTHTEYEETIVVAFRSTLGLFPGLDLLFGLLLGDPILLLDPANEDVAFAIHLFKFIIGDVAPMFLDGALELLPVALDLIPVHLVLPTFKRIH